MYYFYDFSTVLCFSRCIKTWFDDEISRVKHQEYILRLIVVIQA